MILLSKLSSLILVVVVLALACAPSRGQSNITGYEGPPHTGHVQIVGASLEDGFKDSESKVKSGCPSIC